MEGFRIAFMLRNDLIQMRLVPAAYLSHCLST